MRPGTKEGDPGTQAENLRHGGIAQLVEHMTENHGVPGSNPGPATPKNVHLQEIRMRTRAAPFPAPGASTTTRFAEGVRGRPVRG